MIRAILRRKGWVEKKFHFLPKVTLNVGDDSAGTTGKVFKAIVFYCQTLACFCHEDPAASCHCPGGMLGWSCRSCALGLPQHVLGSPLGGRRPYCLPQRSPSQPP